MSLFRRHRWFVAAAGITLAYALVSLTSHQSFQLTLGADSFLFALMLAISGCMFANAATRSEVERGFWILMAVGFFTWTLNQGVWVYLDSQHIVMPSPYFADMILILTDESNICATVFQGLLFLRSQLRPHIEFWSNL